VGLRRIDRTHNRCSRQRPDRIVLTNVAAHRAGASGIRDASLHHQETSATIRRREDSASIGFPGSILCDGYRSKFGLTTGAIVMSFPSRLQIGIPVTATTLIVCSLGVRAKLKMSEGSSTAHRVQTRPAQQAVRSVAAKHEQQKVNQPPR
jgi:hypothetical protein